MASLLCALTLVLLGGGVVEGAPDRPQWQGNHPRIDETGIHLAWKATPGAVRYRVYRNGERIFESQATLCDLPLPPSFGEAIYAVVAVDGEGREGPPLPFKIERGSRYGIEVHRIVPLTEADYQIVEGRIVLRNPPEPAPRPLPLAPTRLLDVADADFRKTVLEAPYPVLVDFWAEWCGPCHLLHPQIKALAREFGGKILVVRVNSDENPALAAKYQVNVLPTLILFHKGREIRRIYGVQPKAALRSTIEAALKGVL
ncbi:MAG: thioredoxin [Deltaproteobacteria bacterium]|nr:MAG: thioredoxin [Deltaproteobacteria bacterium]